MPKPVCGTLSPLRGVSSESYVPAIPLSRSCPGNDGPLVFDVQNPNSQAMKLVSITGNGEPTVSCDQFLSVNALRGLSIDVPQGASTLRVPGGAHLAVGTSTSCQDAVVTRTV
jgi:hypothetical protein